MILEFEHEENARGCHTTQCVPGRRINRPFKVLDLDFFDFATNLMS
jgi:hypothetical protein